jgi:lipopolysaccharide transport system ATP-binding protein
VKEVCLQFTSRSGDLESHQLDPKTAASTMPSISVKNVSKCFQLRRHRTFLMHDLLHRVLLRRRPMDEHWALEDISFSVEDGESVGVIGANGSGKSTLLSLIAKTSYPTTGTVEVEGRVGPMLELGAGFHYSLTGRENIVLNAALLGLSREETEAKLPSIIDYAGVGDYLDAPFHTYSTGMMARLGFAVLAHVEPDILLIDEAFAVGDQEFQNKCRLTMRGLLARGTTMFLVSHNMSMVQELCQRAIWIHHGRIMEMGPAPAVVEQYHLRLLAMLEQEGHGLAL